ncbi:D-arabinono-1,4-lactone oxidase [Rhizodiscina lignyota]|uniref:D-arabinono-1,4-lactone oxidase n=1 Tax=Rhizodiscina lignyota TaxID=1504668 RepID=A0A9P4IR44_9PEZI|nr:D-arabinono-1,4-lactone oxidase [Rhizodiscina lignyota]
MASNLPAEVSTLEPHVPFRATSAYKHHTWAKTYWSNPELYIRPESLEEIQKVVTLARRCRRRLVLVGCGHSPSDLTCTSSWLVNLDNFNKILNVDTNNKTMTVEGGIRLHAINTRAKEHGLTIPNLGSIDEQSIVGAVATATHGSSMYHGLLSQAIRSLRIVLANGRAVRCSATQSPDLFRAALVSLGALGIIVEVEFEMVPAGNIEWIQTLQPLSYVVDNWSTTLWTSAEFTRVWWMPYMKRAIVWRADKTDDPIRAPKSSWYGGSIGFHTYHNLLWLSNYVPWILPTVEWFVFGMQYGFSTGSYNSGVEEQRTGLLMDCLYSQFVNEWALPISKGPEAIERLGAWINGDESKARIPFSSKGLWVHCPIEVRISDTSRPATYNASQPRPFLDNTCATEPTLYLNATLYRPYLQDPPCHKRYYEAFEWLMQDMGGKPHWAKNFAFTTREQIEGMFGDNLESWRRVRDSVDPEGLFVGDWLRRTVLPALKEEGGKAERLPLEEMEVDTKRNNKRNGGLLWFGQQQLKTAFRGSATDGAGDEKVPPSASSEESFDVMHEAEAETSTLLRSMESDDDEATVIAARLCAHLVLSL